MSGDDDQGPFVCDAGHRFFESFRGGAHVVLCPVPRCGHGYPLRGTLLEAAEERYPETLELATAIRFAWWAGTTSLARTCVEAANAANDLLQPLGRVDRIRQPKRVDKDRVLAFRDYARLLGHDGPVLHWIPPSLKIGGFLERLIDIEGEAGVDRDAESAAVGRWALWAPRFHPDSRRRPETVHVQLRFRFAQWLDVPSQAVTFGTVQEQLWLQILHRAQEGELPFARDEAVRTSTPSRRGGAATVGSGSDKELRLGTIDQQVGDWSVGFAPIVTLEP